MNPYRELGISVNDDYDTAKKKYRALCRKYHPDVCGSSREANDYFTKINSCWVMIEKDFDRKKNNHTKKKVSRLTHLSLFNLKRV